MATRMLRLKGLTIAAKKRTWGNKEEEWRIYIGDEFACRYHNLRDAAKEIEKQYKIVYG